MARRNRFNLNYRPSTYWDVPEVVHPNIKGDFRRRQIADAVVAGQVEEVPEMIFRDSLPEKLRFHAASIHPSLMGGEYLPDCEPGQVEIARVSFASTTWDVVSIRACRTGDVIRYSVVDEYADDGTYYLAGK